MIVQEYVWNVSSHTTGNVFPIFIFRFHVYDSILYVRRQQHQITLLKCVASFDPVKTKKWRRI